jgi:hypothetical protein
MCGMETCAMRYFSKKLSAKRPLFRLVTSLNYTGRVNLEVNAPRRFFQAEKLMAES